MLKIFWLLICVSLILLIVIVSFIFKKQFFMMRGHLGQYVIVQPEDNVIIVRLGHHKSTDEGKPTFTEDISTYIDEAYNMLNNKSKKTVTLSPSTSGKFCSGGAL